MTELRAGTVLDERYRIDDVLGVGGFATVYQGYDLASERLVALKVLSSELLESERIRARFEREIAVVARLQCPHTVKLFGRGKTPAGAPYIVFEHVPGRDLREVLADEQKLEPEVVKKIMAQVLLTLAEAHREGVVHRDLKPANIRVFEYDGNPWRVKVLDFGVALARNDDSQRITGANELVGTPRYMSPEQLLGEAPGPASDIYALGIMAWELLNGAEVLHGPRWGDQLARLQSGFVVTGNQPAGAGLSDVIRRMTARKVEERFSSADAVLRALDELREGARAVHETVRERPITATPTRAETPTPAESEVPVPATPAMDWRMALGLCVGIGVGVGGMLLLQSSSNDDHVDTRIVRRVPLEVTRPPQAVVEPQIDARVDAGPAALTQPIVGTVETSGCGKQVAHGRRINRTLSSRRWSVTYVPSSYDPQRKHPVVVMSQTLAIPPAWMFQSTQIQALADKEGFIVAAFDRSDRLTPWGKDDVGFVYEELGALAAELCVDLSQVFVLGHGTGTALAREIACRSNVAGLALVGDVETPHTRCDTGPVPVIRFAGSTDAYVPLEGGISCAGQPVRAAADVEKDWRAANSCTEKSQSWGPKQAGGCVRYACDEAPFVACHIDGGHNWPHSPPQAPFMNATCPNTRTQFPIMPTIWQFFTESNAP